MIKHGQIDIVSFSTIYPQWLGGPSSQLFSVGRIELSNQWKQGMNRIWGSNIVNLTYSMQAVGYITEIMTISNPPRDKICRQVDTQTMINGVEWDKKILQLAVMANISYGKKRGWLKMAEYVFVKDGWIRQRGNGVPSHSDPLHTGPRNLRPTLSQACTWIETDLSKVCSDIR